MITKDIDSDNLIKKIKSFNEQLKKHCKEPTIEGIEEFQEGCTQATIRALLEYKELFYDVLND